MRCNNSRGFTLIELLVAISILAIVAVLGFRGLDSIVRSRTALNSELEQTRGLQLSFAQMQSDCSQNVNPLSYPNMPEHRTSWIEPDRLILIRNDFQDDQAPSMQVVVYRLKNANLVRFESISTRDLAILKQLLSQARTPPDDQVEVVMQKNVQSLEFTGYPPSSLAAISDSDYDANMQQRGGPGNPGGPGGPGNPGGPGDPGNPDGTNKQGAPGNPSGTNNPGDPGNPGDPNNPGGPGQPGNPGIQNINKANVTTGLQVSLRLQKHDTNITKIFMLGGS